MQPQDAAARLLEGLEESFTVNALGLPPALVRCLATTNIIERPNRRVRSSRLDPVLGSVRVDERDYHH